MAFIKYLETSFTFMKSKDVFGLFRLIGLFFFILFIRYGIKDPFFDYNHKHKKF